MPTRRPAAPPTRPLRTPTRAAAALLLACTGLAAQAAIAPGSTGNGELFMSVFDDVAKVSYTLDLGVRMDTFFNTAQQDAGRQTFWEVSDANWADFLGQVDVTNLNWVVMAFDTTGGVVSGGSRLFTTMHQGKEGEITKFGNNNFTNGTAASLNFTNAINTSGTHGAVGATQDDYDVNGSSVNFATEPGAGYFGDLGGASPSINGAAPWTTDNALGESSWFYYLTRSGVTGLGSVLVDEFDNIGTGTAGDGYFGFTYVDADLYPESPYAGKYLLSYTLQSAVPSAAQRAFAQGIGRTEFTGGFAVRTLAELALPSKESAAGLPLPLPGAVPAVPEPQTWALLLAGLAGLAAWRRRA